MGKNRKVSNRAIRNLSGKMHRADRRMSVTAIVAIAVSAMLVILVLSTIMSVSVLMSREKQMMVGTQAEGIYMNTSYDWFEKLRDSGHFDAVAMTAYMGTYETEVSTGSSNRILYAKEETAGWNFNELTEGSWPRNMYEIAVDEHFVEANGGELHEGDRIQMKLSTAKNEIEQEMVISGICTANDALDENRIYMSEEFFQWDRSGYELRTYCRFESGRYDEEDLNGFLQEINPDAVTIVLINPGAGQEAGKGAMALMAGLIILTVVCAGLMIYIIYYISSVRNVKQYGQLKLMGVTEGQIRKILWLQALRLYLTGLPIGCLLGCVVSYVLMPFFSSFAGLMYSQTLMIRPVYFLFAAGLSFFVIYLGIRKPMKILAKTPPIHTVGFTDGRQKRAEKVQSGTFTVGRFARRNIRKRRKKTVFVVVSICIGMVIFVFTMNLVHSLSVDELVAEANLFADIEIATEDALSGMEVGVLVNAEGIPSGLRSKLKDISEGMEVTYHYNLDRLIVLYDGDAEKYCELLLDNESYQCDAYDGDVMLQRANEYRRGEADNVWAQQNYRFYDYAQIENFKVHEGVLDKEKFESGEYVIAVAFTGDGDSYYHAGDVVNLPDEFPEESAANYEKDENGHYPFWDNLATKEYTVLAVVSDEYRNQMQAGNQSHGDFEFIFPTQSMENMSKAPELFMVTMDAPNAETLERVEPLVEKCLNELGGEDVVSYRSRGAYKRELEEFGMVLALIGNSLALMVGAMALVNFLNSCVSGIAERKEEFATLQAIGMTKKQLLGVLRRENLYTVLWAVIPGYLVGHLLSVAAIYKASESIDYLAWNITLLPGIILAVVACLLSMVYPNRRTDIGDKKHA